MFKYMVLDNGKPATIQGSTLWNNNLFDTYEEAEKYAKDWLGIYASCLQSKSLLCNVQMEGKELIYYSISEYSGCGDYVAILPYYVGSNPTSSE